MWDSSGAAPFNLNAHAARQSTDQKSPDPAHYRGALAELIDIDLIPFQGGSIGSINTLSNHSQNMTEGMNLHVISTSKSIITLAPLLRNNVDLNQV